MRRGFTLVELSIVLVILGLLVGGVLAGQSLIRAAELRAVTTEFTNLQIAVGTFKDKYFALPGDMPNAIRYWGKQTGGDADGRDSTCAALTHTTPSTDQRTCNGNGDGIIGVDANTIHERWRGIQHLANAGLIEGSYTGVQGSGGYWHALIGVNTPRSKLRGAGWNMVSTPAAGDGAFFAANYGGLNWYFGTPHHVANSSLLGPALKPEEAYNIDMKIDDGKPSTGNVLAFKQGNTWAGGNCAVSGNANYALSRQTIDCPLVFISGF